MMTNKLMDKLYIPNSIVTNKVSINKETSYKAYKELHCDMTLQEFLNISATTYNYALGGTRGVPVDLYLKEVKQDKIVIPSTYGISQLGYMLTGLSISEITLEEGITNILGIEYCDNLTTIHLPVSLTNISSYGISNNTNLKNVYYAGTMEQWANVTLGYRWNSGTSITVIHCSDGDVTL